VIIKHNNPCGTAEQGTCWKPYLKALACDPVSAFGGVLAFNRAVDAGDGGRGRETFAECIAAPGFADRAKEIFRGQEKPAAVGAAAGGLEPERRLQLKRIPGNAGAAAGISRNQGW